MDKPLTSKLWRLENLYKIKTKDARLVTFKPNRVQKQILREVSEQNPIRHLTLKARQLGISTMWILYHLDDVLFRPNVTSAILANKLENLSYLFGILRTAYDNLPTKLKPKLEKETTSHLSFEHGSQIFVTLETRSVAITGGLHISEAAFCEQERVSASMAACAPGAHISIESTPNGINFFWNAYLDAKDSKSDFKATFFPWFYDDGYKIALNGNALPIPDADERKHNLSPEQILFRRTMKGRLGRAFVTEFAEDDVNCFGSSSSNFFDVKKILTLAKEAREHDKESPPTEDSAHQITWEKPEAKHIYVIGCDVAEGIGEDFSAIKAMCVTCRQEALSFKGRVGLDRLSIILADLGRKYNDALLAVERNGPGLAVLLTLRELQGYGNLYRENSGGLRSIRGASGPRQEPKYGWLTTSNSKVLSLNQFKSGIEGSSDEDVENFEPEIRVHDLRFLDEALSFRNEDGRLAAAGTAHDDLVMASAICFQMYLLAKGKLKPIDLSGIRMGSSLESLRLELGHP